MNVRTVAAVVVFLGGLAALIWALAAPAPGRGGGEGGERFEVAVTIPPLVWVARELAPGGSRITLLIPPGASPHTTSLTPEQAAAVRSADLVLMVGLGLEPGMDALLASVGEDAPPVVDFGPVAASEGVRSTVDGQGVVDPHAWLDPLAMKAYVEAARAAMEPLVPEGERAALAGRAAHLRSVCDELHAEYVSRLAGSRGAAIVTHHHAYGYLAARYGLRVAAVLRPVQEVESTPGDIAAAREAIESLGVRSIFVEPQFSASTAERLARAAGVRVLELDPLGEGSYPEMMRANLDALADGLSP